jgi:hypothetical protein
MLKDLPEPSVETPALRDGLLTPERKFDRIHVQREAVRLVVDPEHGRRHLAEAGVLEPAPNLRGTEEPSPIAIIGRNPPAEMAWLYREVQKQHLDLQDVPHRIQGDGELPREGGVKSCHEVGASADNQPAGRPQQLGSLLVVARRRVQEAQELLNPHEPLAA